MTLSKISRGRPKGSGLNDAAQLRAIAGLIAGDPELKPTTAIKRLGINDPSVIRRLRDKFHAVEAELVAELRGASTVLQAARLPSAQATQAESSPAEPMAARTVTLAAARETRKVEPVAATPSAPVAVVLEPAVAATEMAPPTRPLRPRSMKLPSETELPSWIGVGLSLYVLGIEAQFAVAGTMFQWPPLAAVLRSQAAFTDVAIAMTAPAAKLHRLA